MSILGNDSPFRGISGKFADLIVFRQVRGKTVMAIKPKPSPHRTAAQKKENNKFRMAVAYASAVIKDPETKALYQQGIHETKFSAYHVAISDYLNAPVIESVVLDDYSGVVGSAIVIDASDDFRVKSVNIIIHDQHDVEIERGAATRHSLDQYQWEYLATKKNATSSGCRVTVTASDYAGNTTNKILVMK